MENVNLYLLQMQSLLLDELNAAGTSSQTSGTSGTDENGLSFDDILSSCLSGVSSTSSLSALESASSTASFSEIEGLSDTTSLSSLASLLGVSGVSASSSVSASETAGNTVSTAGNMTISDTGVQFIEDHEGYSATAYRGADAQNETIGYGHVIQSGENFSSLTKTQATSLLENDLSTYEDSVNKEFSGTKLTQNQFDALVSLSYNLGTNIWSKAPTLTNDIKSGASASTLKTDFERLSYCNGKQLQGLLNRRDDEWSLFTSGTST